MKTLLILFTFCLSVYAQSGSEFMNGADLSFIPQVEENGGTYYNDGIAADPFTIFAQNGVNYVRFRIWHTPPNGYCNLEKTIEVATRAKQAGFKFLLDFHYSDSWADPGKQYKPAAWNTLDYETLLDSIYTYTFNVIKTLDTLEILPDMVQVGNEITPGFLWNTGRVGGQYDTPAQWTQFTSLLKKAILAVHDAASDTVKIMIHIDRGGNNSASRWFFDNLRNYGVNYDVIGQSYYPWWHGNLTSVRQNLNDLALRYNKDIVIAETAYPWTLDWYDNTGNIVGNDDPLHDGYPPSVQGQYSFLYDLIRIIKEVPNGKGIGIFYWAPDWISTPSYGSSWENLALFDFQGNTLNSMKVFKETEIDTSNAINVTFTLNTATNFDTLSPTGFVQLRGEVINSADVLASGEELTWDINSDVILNNIDGDYWQTTVRVPVGTEIQYKYWTGHSANKPTFLRVGNEGPISSYDASVNLRKFVAGSSDTVLTTEYYNSTGESRSQFWSPFENKDSLVAVYLRVNMSGVTNAGRFNPSVNGPVGIRGEPSTSMSLFSWEQTKVILERESLSVGGGSFWSGKVYFPKSAVGIQTHYKFFIENDSGNGWENSIDNRSFNIPVNDTTIQWVYFDNNNTVVGVQDHEMSISSFNLYQNYPNPFNNSTMLTYQLPEKTVVNITVYNSLGETVYTLLNAEKDKGTHTITWNGKNLSGNDVTSGIYFIRMSTTEYSESIKAILLK